MKQKTYHIEESVSGESQDIKADSALSALMKWLERDKKLYEGKNDRKGDEFEWDFEVTRK